MLIGYDGLSIAQSVDGPDFDLSKAQIYLALASEVPVDGQIVANPYKNWSEIDPSLPDEPIQVFGPPPTSGTRDAFVELVMLEGCADFPEIAALDEARHEEVCSRMRQDGPFIEAGENDNLIVQRLQADPHALGIFGYSFLFENSDTLKAAAIDGVVPDEDTIASGEYARGAPALHLHQERAPRGDPRARRVRRRVCLRRRLRPGRLSARARPDRARRRGARRGPRRRRGAKPMDRFTN